MIKLSGYDKIQKVDSKSYYTLYSGRAIQSFRPVHLKHFYPETYLSFDLNSFAEELRHLKKIKSDHVVEFIDLIPPDDKSQTGPILIYESVSGKSLSQVIKERLIDIISFLEMAIQLSSAIAALHKAGFFANEIIPEHIIVNPKNNSIKITHLGLRSLKLLYEQDFQSSMMVYDVLPYISPEQTGRVRWQADYRSDFYVIGTILYAMLIGKPPFVVKKPMEIIYGHIAQKPIPPMITRNDIPEAISDLIMKLLAKNPEDRYQSVYSLQIDLQNYLVEYSQTKSITCPSSEKHDVYGTFRPPEKFYGRQIELDELLSALQKVQQGRSQTLLFEGYPGIGKSRLIAEFEKATANTTVFFISGKYDSFSQNIPYHAIIEAYRTLIQQVLLMDDKEIDRLRETILTAIEPNAQILIDIIPEIEILIGRQPPLLELSPDETQNRFQMTCAAFTSIFATQDQPLILFLDDLQWMDSASLKLIEKLLTNFDQQYFLFIGAYRDNEVNEQHPLSSVIESIRNKRPQTRLIHLDPLTSIETQQIVADTFFVKASRIPELAEIIFNKTHGNAFFILQYLQSLHSDNILTYNFENGQWQWDMDQILYIDPAITENTEDLIVKRIQKLSSSAREFLELTACIGNRLILSLISAICKKELSDVSNDIIAAIDAGFISPPLDNSCLSLIGRGRGRQQIDEPDFPIEIAFVHDTIRQVIYQMIPDDRRLNLHLRIGRTLHKKQEGEKIENLITAVTHLNLAIPLLSNGIEKKEIAKLNLIAGKQAIKSNAYATARIYFETGTALLSPTAWDTDFELIADLQKKRAVCEYLCGNFMVAENLFQETVSKMKTTIEKVELFTELILLYTSMNKLDAAIDLGIKGARMLGIRISRSPRVFTLGLEFLKFRWRLGFRRIESLSDLPAMSDKKQIAIEHLLTNLRTAARYNNPRLYLLTVFLQINAYLQYGNSIFSPIGYAAVGGVMAAIMNAYHAAYAYGALALKLADKTSNEKVSCTTEYIFAWYIQHWQKPVFNNIAYYEKAHSHALKTGNLIIGAHSVNMIFMTRFIIGEPLAKVFSEYVKQESFLLKINDSFIYENFRSNIRLFLKFLGPDKKYHHLNRESEPSQIQPLMTGSGMNQIFQFHVLLNKLISHFVFSNYTECIQYSQEAETVAPVARGTLQYAIYHFFRALTLLMTYPDTSPQNTRRYRREMKQSKRKLKTYSETCPENFLPFYCLVNAEIARIKNNFEQSIKLYRKSMCLFKDMGYIHFEALANEMAARAHYSMGFEKMGRVYITEAHALYLKWGAIAKVSDLENNYSVFQNESAQRKQNTLPHLFDYAAIVQTMRSISTEIRLSDLLKKLMRISVINAGAEKGFFISKTAGSLYVEAYYSPDIQTPVIINSRPIAEQPDILKPFVHYAAQSMKPMVLENASQNETYSSNEYVRENHLKSVLCLPVIRQSMLVGIMYFENNVIAGAFTAKHIEGLQLVASQAAISFENATLYEHVIKKEAELQDRSEKLRSLSAELVLAEEKERRRIAIELHDRIGQSLTASRIKIGNLQQTADAVKIRDELNEIMTLIKQTIRDTRSLTFELSPHALYELGLEAALDHLAEQTRNQYGLWVEFEDDLQYKPIDESTRILIYQATRELLFNVVKHSQAKKVTLAITREGKNICIEVSDNGIGFNPDHLRSGKGQPKGFGILSIKERLFHQGGHFQIISAPGQGTRTILKSPMNYVRQKEGVNQYEHNNSSCG